MMQWVKNYERKYSEANPGHVCKLVRAPGGWQREIDGVLKLQVITARKLNKVEFK